MAWGQSFLFVHDQSCHSDGDRKLYLRRQDHSRLTISRFAQDCPIFRFESPESLELPGHRQQRTVERQERIRFLDGFDLVVCSLDWEDLHLGNTFSSFPEPLLELMQEDRVGVREEAGLLASASSMVTPFVSLSQTIQALNKVLWIRSFHSEHRIGNFRNR